MALHLLFQDILNCLQKGIDKIYAKRRNRKAKISPFFEREYNLKYFGGIGNVFHTKDIDAAIEKGKLFDSANHVAMSPKSCPVVHLSENVLIIEINIILSSTKVHW